MEVFGVDKGFLNEIRSLLYKKTGIFLNSDKDALIINRVKKFARESNIIDRNALLKKIAQNEQDFINVFTTNKTDFFREGFHFLDIMDRIIPNFCKEKRKRIRVYCSASSTGEEPYSIAATLLHAKEMYGMQDFSISVLATDIDTDVLGVARQGVYQINSRISPLPVWIDLEKYFIMRKLDSTELYMEARPNLKSVVTFKQFNLFSKTYPFHVEEFDIIFCRNVLIYFKVEDQEQILENLFRHLKVLGTLYLGHSESILSLGKYVNRLGQNTFVKK